MYYCQICGYKISQSQFVAYGICEWCGDEPFLELQSDDIEYDEAYDDSECDSDIGTSYPYADWDPDYEDYGL